MSTRAPAVRPPAALLLALALLGGFRDQVAAPS